MLGASKRYRRHCLRDLVLFFFASSLSLSHGFTTKPLPLRRRLHSFRVMVTQEPMEEQIFKSDDTLLASVTKQQLADLCKQFELSTKGTKEVLLKRLRNFAAEQLEAEKQRQKERVRVVEEGTDNANERHEIVDDYEALPDEDDDVFFYYPIPNDKSTTVDDSAPQKAADTTASIKVPRKPPITQASLTAPPPPAEVNANGERVVTVYSTSQQNDLTGVAAAQPGQYAADILGAGTAPVGEQPWDVQSTGKSKATSKELEAAKEKVSELVASLLASTGAPAFKQFCEDGQSDSPNEFVGFQPSRVSSQELSAASQALRAGRGQVLQEVMREFELQAIGQDGMAGDDTNAGGGHFREVSKVRAFLDGFRRAEVRRLARETSAMLLDKLVLEGVDGLDITLATMSRTSDDTGEYAGELNDSLVDYLNDAIRQQEKKVEKLLNSHRKNQESTLEDNDRVGNLWDVTIEDGERVETLDPNNPRVRNILLQEYENEISGDSSGEICSSSEYSAQEQLLLLLTLLRERIKAEAAFAPDEKGRNLRLLAYCIRVKTDKDREQLIAKEVGTSMDRLDSFMELVASSIEYGESTSHQLQPSKKRPLNVPQLKAILRQAKDLREKQRWSPPRLKM